MSTWLLDTGPIVAYLDSSDGAHAAVASKWDEFRGQFATTSAVITEAMYFLAAVRGGPIALAELIAASGAEVFDLTQPPELAEAAALMERYSDTPMDYADATLVLLAEPLDTHEVLTLDRRGFATYRTRPNRPFHNVLDLA